MEIVIALYRPQIPPNTGNIARLCVALDSELVIVGKPSFSWDDKQLRRAGLDHWDKVRFTHMPRFKDFYLSYKERRIIPVTKVGNQHLFEFSFSPQDVVLFGNETAGLPPKVLKFFPISLRLPMWGPVRSLNLANAVAVVAYEYYRQMYTRGLVRPEVHPPRTYYREKNFSERQRT